jgi:hypothetical protein
MSYIIDFSTARPSIAQLKSADVISIGRYLGWDGVSGYPNTGKNITKTEATSYLASGISIFLAFEYLASAPALGAEQGAKDGALASEQMAAIGAPTTAGVYFAVDFDIPDYAPSEQNVPASAMAKLGPVGEYFKAIKALKPLYRIGVYGGYWAVKRLFDAGLVTLGWQTVAWSGGNVDPRIALLQTVDASPIAGSDINVHEATQLDYGQWPGPKVTPPPGTIVVPDVRGMEASVGVSKLAAAGLHPHGNPLPTITEQSPAPGAKVAAGTVISLTYSN